MTEQSAQRHPTEINLHSKSRLLTVTFDDGMHCALPCEYLRVFSRAAEVRTAAQPVTGKENVNIVAIEPLGQYAIRLRFDDGHDTGIYSWDTLYQLGVNQAENWADYLATLHKMGYQRAAPNNENYQIRLLYFAWLAQKLRREMDEVTLPPSVQDVATLLTWLGARQRGAAALFAPQRLQVTVNKQFSELFTVLHDGDEVALVPTTPTPPPTPGFF